MEKKKLLWLVDTKLVLAIVIIFLLFLLSFLIFTNTSIFQLYLTAFIILLSTIFFILFIKSFVSFFKENKDVFKKRIIPYHGPILFSRTERGRRFINKIKNTNLIWKIYFLFFILFCFIYNIIMSNKKLRDYVDIKIFIVTIAGYLVFLFIFVSTFAALLFLFVITIFLVYNFMIKHRKFRDFISTKMMLSITIIFIIFFFIMFIFILYKSLFILGSYSLSDILFASVWNPEYGQFGLYPIITVTIIVTGIALLIAVPISILSAIYITEYSPKRIRKTIRPFIDVLAGVPSVVYGLCAYLVLVPLVKDVIAPWFGIESTGSCVFTAAITLAIMVFPIIISLCIESFDAIPISLKEASLSVGATKWETVKKVVFRASAPGIISAVLLGFGRAFGETIAVSMVIGGIPQIPSSIFGPGQTLASLIVSAYSEMMSVPLYESALMMVTLILFIVVLFVNIVGVIALRRTRRRWNF
jgi:phosphate transport system permease protein